MTTRSWAGGCVGVFALGLSACGSDAEPETFQDVTGSVQIGLNTQVNGVLYRLRDATFKLAGPQALTLNGESEPDTGSIQRTVTAGTYAITLLDGWRVEKQFPSGFQTVAAALTSPNPQFVWISPTQKTDVGFQFFTDGVMSGTGSGNVGITIGVADRTNPPATLSTPTLAAGNFHSCARIGTNARCWGNGAYGKLGLVATTDVTDASSAANVNVGGPVTQIVASVYHTCALLKEGGVRCWGYGGEGRLGYGNVNNIGDNEAPANAGDVHMGWPAKQLSSGTHHTCAVLVNGSVRCWGSGLQGALGYGNTNNIGDNESPSAAGAVNVGGSVKQIAAGAGHTCALLEAGTVRCWGVASEGQLGYANTTRIGDNESPASAGDVNVGGTVVQITAGASHTCALLVDGTVRCWGFGLYGRLGYGNVDTIGDNEAPAVAGAVPLDAPVVQIAAGGVHTCAVLATGGLRCWGQGAGGQLGLGSTDNIGDDQVPMSAPPIDVGGPVFEVGAGGAHTCALLNTRAVRCWGVGQDGQLGIGTRINVGDDEEIWTAGDVLVLP